MFAHGRQVCVLDDLLSGPRTWLLRLPWMIAIDHRALAIQDPDAEQAVAARHAVSFELPGLESPAQTIEQGQGGKATKAGRGPVPGRFEQQGIPWAALISVGAPMHHHQGSQVGCTFGPMELEAPAESLVLHAGLILATWDIAVYALFWLNDNFLPGLAGHRFECDGRELAEV